MPAPLVAALKRGRRRDDVVGEDAAIAPPADAETIRIGDARARPRSPRPPARPPRPCAPSRRRSPTAKLLASPRAAPRVRGDDDVAAGREPLPAPRRSSFSNCADRAAVDPQDRRIAAARHRSPAACTSSPWICGAVLALERVSSTAPAARRRAMRRSGADSARAARRPRPRRPPRGLRRARRARRAVVRRPVEKAAHHAPAHRGSARPARPRPGPARGERPGRPPA